MVDQNNNSPDLSIRLRNLKLSDYPQLRKAMVRAYSAIQDDHWKKDAIKRLLNVFPDGQLCIEVNGEVVAAAFSIIVDYSRFRDDHTYEEITAKETFSTHDPEQGDVLYGIDIFVHPEYRGMRLARRLYDARKELCENLNLRAIIAGGRIPNYEKYADRMNPRTYIEKVRMKEIYDPTLTFQLSNDFHVKKLLKKYLSGDTQSFEYATLLEWNNIYYDKEERLINRPRSSVRVGLIQWQMRPFADLDALIEQMEFFVDAVSGYQTDFILFPAFFNAPLMAEFDHLGEAKAIRKLADYTEPLRRKAVDMAIAYNVNIIAGSMPVVRRSRLYHTAFLCRRDGSWESMDKIHTTPAERASWGMAGGNVINAFETDCCRIGLLICDDVEFPELSRILADQDVQILFVPFLTDSKNAFHRVHCCARARAIENECYVVIAGAVGNLPRVSNMDIQYAQSAIFTPVDFAFPHDAVQAETSPNTEMTLVADLDLDLIQEIHSLGSVRNLNDRRNDLYRVQLTPSARKRSRLAARKRAKEN